MILGSTTITMKRSIFLLIVSALMSLDGRGEDGFAPLFIKDGAPEGFVVRNWSDVSQPPPEGAAWEVRDGVLRSTGSRGCWLVSEKEYGDFILEYEFKLGPLGNSGCALRAPMKGDPAFDGLEMQMADFPITKRRSRANSPEGFIAPRRLPGSSTNRRSGTRCASNCARRRSK